MAEKGFQDGHATAYQTGADFSCAVGGREKLARKRVSRGEERREEVTGKRGGR